MNFKIGDILKGRVTKLIKIGAFIDIGEQKIGFVHISEITRNFINLPSDILKVNDIVDVKIISLDDNKIKLSIKQAKDSLNNNLNKFSKKINAKDSEIKLENFEDMIKKFKISSEQKLFDLKRHTNNRQKNKKH